MAAQAQVTQLLADFNSGRREALDELFPLIYEEMHLMAHRQRRRNYAGETINTTALVHETYCKLVDQQSPSWEGRLHFFRVAARAMRQILVDYARRQRAEKRGGGQANLALDDVAPRLGAGLLSPDKADEILALDEALTRLAAFDERQSQIVELRYFTGLTIPETADALGLSPATVKREWTTARAWLFRDIRGTL